MPRHTFELNGRSTTVDVPADMPLLWVLRDVLQLTGTKFGCGIMQCGACTVHLDGRPARTCTLPISQVRGRSVTTIEGLGAGGLHPAQQAWIDAQVPQCGYCQSGQIMVAAAALLGRGQRPTREDVDRAMAGNICRCGSYPRIRAAIEAALDAGAAEPARGGDAGSAELPTRQDAGVGGADDAGRGGRDG